MISRNVRSLAQSLAQKLKPRPRINGLEYAERYGYVTGHAESRGKWHTRPYQRDWFLAVTDPNVECMVCQKPSRIGWSEYVKIGFIQFHCDWRPSKIMIVQPTDDEVKKYSREDIDALFDSDSGAPRLKGLLSNQKSKTSSANTYNFKQLTNGALIDLRSAATPKSMRRVERSRIAIEEPAAYDKLAEGDSLQLILQRAGTAADPFFTIGGTPVFPNDYMDQCFKMGDQQYRYYPCPHCREYQQLAWNRFIKQGPDAGKINCSNCDGLIEYRHLRTMDEHAGWACPLGLDRSNQILRDGQPVWRSQQVGPGMSYHRAAAWPELVRRYRNAEAQLRIGNPDPMQTFHNTDLGVTWIDVLATQLTAEGLAQRRQNEAHGNGYPDGVIPNGVLMILVAVDSQGGGGTADERLVVHVWGFGRGEEAWHLAAFEIDGDPQQKSTLDQLIPIGETKWTREDGCQLRMALGGIDEGGLATEEIRRWCAAQGGRWVPVRGQSSYGQRNRALPLVGKGKPVEIDRKNRAITRPSRGALLVYRVGYDASIKYLQGRLREEQPGPGYVHFGMAATDDVLAEIFPWRRIPKRGKSGETTYSWDKPAGSRDEAGDCLRYAYALLQVVARRYNRATMWDQLEAQLGKAESFAGDELNRFGAGGRFS